MITALIVMLWVAFTYLVLVGVGFIWKPALPTVLLGFVIGPIRRENEQGGEVYSNDTGLSLLVNARPLQLFPDEEKYYVTHLQYRARSWFLLCWPMIFHFCFWQPRFQKTELDPNDPTKTNRVPGSELAFYGRLFGWRKQKPDAQGGYILSKGYPPFGHLD